jgi:hypothetical protein
MLVGLSMPVGCTRPSRISETASGDQTLPFLETSQTQGESTGRTSEKGNLPAGFPIAIRLKTPVSSASAHAGDGFDGALDDPLLIDGQVAIGRGAAVHGQVLSAKASRNPQDPGYLRIALVSITVAGKPLSLQTSSIFVKGGARKRNLAMIGGGTGTGSLVSGSGSGKGALIGTSSETIAGANAAHAKARKDVWLGSEQRLTFRLAQPADLHARN